MQVKPGQGWAHLLLAPPTTEWLLQLLPALQRAAAVMPLAQHARALLVALCSLAGDIFPRPQAGNAAASITLGHLQQMLRGVLPLVHPSSEALHQALASDEGALLDGCKALSALCTNHKPAALDAAAQVLAASGGAPHMFAVLQTLTCALLQAGGASGVHAPEPWVHECTDMLLEAWASVLTPQCSYAGCKGAPAAAAEGACVAFGALVDAALKDATHGAHEVRVRGACSPVPRACHWHLPVRCTAARAMHRPPQMQCCTWTQAAAVNVVTRHPLGP